MARSDSPTDEPSTDPQPGDDVRLIEKPAIGLMSTPSIITGRVSSTGKTVIVPAEEGFKDKRRQLDADTIFAGGMESRRATGFRLYTPERFQRSQRANKAPGPQAGVNRVSDVDDLPPATHQPEDE